MQQEYISEIKQNRLHQNNFIMTQSTKSRDQFTHNTDAQQNGSTKSSTKLPPLKKARIEQVLTDKTSELPHVPNMQRKITEPQKKIVQSQNSYIVRKVGVKKKTDKKKPLQEQFKPEVLQKYQQYMSFLSLVNISNNVKISCSEFDKPYVLYVGKGNHGSLIKSIFRSYRPWWIIEEANPDNPHVNFHWYQIRQNSLLEKLKEHPSTQQEHIKLEYYVDKQQHQEKEEEEAVSLQKSSQGSRIHNQRSQSLVTKQAITTAIKKNEGIVDKKNTDRRSTFNKSTDKITKFSPATKQHSIREIKQQVMEAEQNLNNQKKALANPKMWPIYYTYRRIFSAVDMKNIKKLKVIREDGSIKSTLQRNKMKIIENRSSQIRMHNHLANNWNLSNKKALFINIKHYFESKKINPFEYIPMTFHVENIGDKEYDSFIEQYHRRCQQITNEEKNNKKQPIKTGYKPKKRNAWLIKPGQNTNRGVGIQVVESIEQIKEIITKQKTDCLGGRRTHIIQQYIMPFLYQKRKFDIRCYILMTSVNGIQKGYWFQDGYIRTACKQFNMKNLANRMIHLTNDAVQKHCEDYGKFEPGNKLSFADFQRYLDNNYNNIQNGPKYKFWQQAYPEMKKLATEAIRSVYTKINPQKKQFSFQIFGLDFLIDENFKVWLIEANTNPCLELSAPLLGRVIPSMLQNAFKIAVDPIFPPPSLTEISKLTKKIYLPQNSLENNKFQLVFDEVQEGGQLKGLLTNGPEIQIYNIEEQEEEYVDEDKQNEIEI